MDPYKSLAMEFLQSDWAVFLNTKLRIQFDKFEDTHQPGQHHSCDAVAIDLRHGALYLCDIVPEPMLELEINKLSAWTKNWDSVKAALCRDCSAPVNWRVYVWLFVPKASIELLDEKLEDLRMHIGARFKVKITTLEDVHSWHDRTLKRP